MPHYLHLNIADLLGPALNASTGNGSFILVPEYEYDLGLNGKLISALPGHCLLTTAQYDSPCAALAVPYSLSWGLDEYQELTNRGIWREGNKKNTCY